VDLQGNHIPGACGEPPITGWSLVYRIPNTSGELPVVGMSLAGRWFAAIKSPEVRQG
jgi:hypothetical protein